MLPVNVALEWAELKDTSAWRFSPRSSDEQSQVEPPPPAATAARRNQQGTAGEDINASRDVNRQCKIWPMSSFRCWLWISQEIDSIPSWEHARRTQEKVWPPHQSGLPIKALCATIRFHIEPRKSLPHLTEIRLLSFLKCDGFLLDLSFETWVEAGLKI